jgi:hypothetical protein
VPQLFRPFHNSLSRLCILVFIGGALLAVGLGNQLEWSSYWNREKENIPQPVMFSHQHHVGGLGIDCRYCHTGVETSSFAGMPPTETCMTCHSQLWRQAPLLQPVIQSFQNNRPIQWNKVYDLPDFVYFNHSIHVHKGIGCSTCHGQVDTQPLMRVEKVFYMRTCLECHRNPGPSMRPPDQITSMNWKMNTSTNAISWSTLYHIKQNQLTDCSVCHR